MKLGIVVLTYNRSDALLAVLRGLASQCQADDVVVVADDGSRPEQVQAMRQGLPVFPCAAWHVWQPDVGFTAGRSRNLGASVAHQMGADYVVFMDGDCVPRPDYLAAHRALAERGCFVNGSRVLLDKHLTEQVCTGLDPARVPLWKWLSWRLGGHVNKLTHLWHWHGVPGRREAAFRWRGIRSCNLAVWWQDLAAVNGFDETFSGWGHEDADLVLRLHNHGLVRKNGHWATEVLHLWHREASRENESANRARVHRRQARGATRASVGLAEADDWTQIQVRPLAGQAGQ